MERVQVQNAINAAFAELPIPNPRTILRRDDLKSSSSAESFRRELAGKRWQSLPSKFWSERWAAFCYLSPEAYRYYLPALLTAALQDFQDDSGLAHSVVYGLRPSFWSLYYQGEDRDLRDRQSAFTASQYFIVCLFLGLVFERLPRLRHLAAQALHWGWNRFDTPALVAANTYYHELYNFSYPEPPDPKVAALCHEISTAFAATPYPGDNELSGSDRGDEPAENAMELRGVKWQSAHPLLIAQCDTALSFLSSTGFRYFLPAFLFEDLLAYDLGYGSNADPVFHLTHGFYDKSEDQFVIPDEIAATVQSTVSGILERHGLSSQDTLETLKRFQEQQKRSTFDWREYGIRRFMHFNRDERVAIIHYLEYRAVDEFAADKINQALEGYWRPSVQSASI